MGNDGAAAGRFEIWRERQLSPHLRSIELALAHYHDSPSSTLQLFNPSGDDFADDVAVDVGEPEVAAGVAEGEAFVVEA